VNLAAGLPLHIHIAEQDAEVQEVQSAWNARPVEWLLANQPVDESWCLVHATQMLDTETQALANTKAIAGLCPITVYCNNKGRLGIGTDSNVRISLSEELRTLEYSQRLKNKGRAIYAQENRSTGRVLFDHAASGGAQALQRESGVIDACAVPMLAVDEDRWLDAWIFASDDSLVTDVWVSGQHMVRAGRHVDRERIEQRYRKTLTSLLARL